MRREILHDARVWRRAHKFHQRLRILPNGQRPELAAERLRIAVEEMPFLCDASRTIRLTVSIGVGCSPLHATTPEALLRAADVALYAAKRAGRNRVEIADESTT